MASAEPYSGHTHDKGGGPLDTGNFGVSSLVGAIADAQYSGFSWLQPAHSTPGSEHSADFHTQVGMMHRRWHLRHTDAERAPLAVQLGEEKVAEGASMIRKFLHVFAKSGQWKVHRVAQRVIAHRRAATTLQRAWRQHIRRRDARLTAALRKWQAADESDLRQLRQDAMRTPYVKERQEAIRQRLTEITAIRPEERCAAIVGLYRQQMRNVGTPPPEVHVTPPRDRNAEARSLQASSSTVSFRSAKRAAAAVGDDVQAARQMLSVLRRQWQKERVGQMRYGVDSAAKDAASFDVAVGEWTMRWLEYRPKAAQGVQDKIDGAERSRRESEREAAGESPALSSSLRQGRRRSSLTALPAAAAGRRNSGTPLDLLRDEMEQHLAAAAEEGKPKRRSSLTVLAGPTLPDRVPVPPEFAERHLSFRRFSVQPQADGLPSHRAPPPVREGHQGRRASAPSLGSMNVPDAQVARRGSLDKHLRREPELSGHLPPVQRPGAFSTTGTTAEHVQGHEQAPEAGQAPEGALRRRRSSLHKMLMAPPLPAMGEMPQSLHARFSIPIAL
eukprot:TRINITY_DN13303_c0_g1_i1.p1 TRINITY_DN13303_c0_g1~~TRINITY_DN13303_c0_g1_i1.p1  ORF type:complete len:557 (+),score=121.22 TRINITY_DN13303_c0_g1_i1:95-1765(+)